jgi:hypothetical protein
MTAAPLRLLAVGGQDVSDMAAGLPEALSQAEITTVKAGEELWSDPLDDLPGRLGRRPDDPPTAVVLGLASALGLAAAAQTEQVDAVVGRIRELWPDCVLVLVNVSCALPAEYVHGGGLARVRALNLAAVELSHRFGSYLLDADRLVAELGGDGLVHGPGRYGAEACAVLQAELVRVLALAGLQHPTTTHVLRLPKMGHVQQVTVTGWRYEIGQMVKPGSVVCDVAVLGRVRFHRPTSALDLASISGRRSLVRRLVGRERLQHAKQQMVGTVVALDRGVLREIRTADGVALAEGDELALLTPDDQASLDTNDPSRLRLFGVAMEFVRPVAVP